MLGSFAEGKWAEITKGIDFNKLVIDTNKFFDSNNFNTEIPADKKVEFDNWAKTNVTDNGNDYDYAGAFMERYQPGGKVWDRASSENNHLPDKYKKPNHPTFSTESIYAKGEYAQHAGTWTQKQSGDWMYNPSKTRLEAVRKVAKF